MQNYQGDGHKVSWELRKRRRSCKKKYMRNRVNNSKKTGSYSCPWWNVLQNSLTLLSIVPRFFHQICQDCFYWIPLRIWHLSAFYKSFVSIYFNFHGFLHREKTLMLLASLLWWSLINHTGPKSLCSLTLSFAFCPITLYIIFALPILRGNCYKT